METFVENQLALLEKERQLEIDENSELLGQRSVQQLQRRGLALGGLRITALRTGLGGKSVVDFEPPLHLSTFLPHRIRSGDIIAITEDLRVSVNTPTGTSLAVSKTVSANPSATVGAPLKPNETVPFVDGVVLKVTDTVITVAVKEELPVEWEDRCKMYYSNNFLIERQEN
ncbi:hypothetical protein K7432_006087 [Basidiobolus ranarum]|uniref:Helicase SMUBP-2/HCS1 1B domain-containing protein n=1 Tax=Basidiobolus ranarum TaxID=34480 RepID=A0ABR2WVG9_9FUNG